MTRSTMRRTAMAACVLLAGAALIAQSSWVDFKSVDGRFSIAVPCQLKMEKTQTPRVGAKPSSTDNLGLCTAVDEIYAVGWTDYEESYTFADEPELIANRDNLLKGLKANLLTSSWLTVGGVRTLEFTGNSEGTRLITSRVWLVGRRPYQLGILTPLASNRAANIRRFLTSFRLDEP
jgi:hypothetical protein